MIKGPGTDVLSETRQKYEGTKLPPSDNVFIVHNNLLLAWYFYFFLAYAIRRLFFCKAIINFLFATLGGVITSSFTI